MSVEVMGVEATGAREPFRKNDLARFVFRTVGTRLGLGASSLHAFVRRFRTFGGCRIVV
jgi:hypothetical protein